MATAFDPYKDCKHPILAQYGKAMRRRFSLFLCDDEAWEFRVDGSATGLTLDEEPDGTFVVYTEVYYPGDREQPPETDLAEVGRSTVISTALFIAISAWMEFILSGCAESIGWAEVFNDEQESILN